MNIPLRSSALSFLANSSTGRRCLTRVLLALLAVAGFALPAAGAAYDFLSVSNTGPKSSVFTSPNGNGTITVTSTGTGPSDNLIINGEFKALFPGVTGIRGHIAQLKQKQVSTFTFDFSNYNLSPALVFGLWNIMPTTEAIYKVQIFDAASNLIAPIFTWNHFGNDDNTATNAGQVTIGAYSMVLNPITGFFQTPFKGPGTHTDASFWNTLPAKTRKIVVTGNLNNAVDVDGIGSFFAEPHGFKFDCGMAVVTCSSANLTDHWVPCGNGPSDLSPNAYVVGIIDTRDPVGVGAPFGSSGGGWKPAMWHNDSSLTDKWNAKNLGEVFGIALDDNSPPNIYVAATSIYYGNGRGPGGDGGVYKLSGTTYGISVFQDFTSSPKKIGKVSLGNLCFDKEHRQFFVTDLDNGLIRRLGITGAEVLTGGAPYDHGVTGRANISALPIPDSPATPGQLTQSGRRVFGVQVFRSRLYYSVWYAPSSSATGYNEVWSVGLQTNGDFITAGPNGPRREFTLQGLAPFSDYPSSEPVITDIAFSESGKMLVGERSICAGDPSDLSSGAHAARAVEYTFTSSWAPSQYLSVGGQVGNSGRVNSAGGVDYDCFGHEFVTGDALISDDVIANQTWPYTGSAVYGLQIFPTPTNTVTTSWLVDFDANYSIYDKLSNGDVEVVRCCDCLQFSNERLECLGTNRFTWSFCVTNSGTLTNGHFVFLDLPAGVTVDPPILDLNPLLLPGQGLCTNVTFILDPTVKTNDLCFRIAAHTEDYATCCVVSKCLTVPDCCGIITQEKVVCDPVGAGGLSWNFSFSNNSGTTVKYLYVIPEPPGCVSAGANVIVLNPPLPNGASTNITVNLSVTNSPCDSACFRIALHDSNFVACCSFTHCVSLRCKGDNHPPIVDCVPLLKLCDPAGGQGYTINAGVMDPDGDALTVIWKVDNVAVKTNTVSAGTSSTSTPVQLVYNFTPGVHTVTMCVSDGNGPPTICTTTVEVGDHQPPQIQCPPDQVIEKWEFPLPDLKGQVIVSDNCTPTGQIKITQEPPPGTILTATNNCIKFTATDLAGNTATCITCFTLAPLRLTGFEGAPGFPSLKGFGAPADFTLGVAGDLAGTAAVEYFANEVSLGVGSGADFRRAWSRVPAGNYVVVAQATKKGASGMKIRSAPAYVLVAANPVNARSGTVGLAVVRAGTISLSLATAPGDRCFIEVADSLDSTQWLPVRTVVGDGGTHRVEFEATGPTQFIRVRVE